MLFLGGTQFFQPTYLYSNKIEVAYFISTLSYVSGTVEDFGKGNVPKGNIPVYIVLGHIVKSCMTVIRRWGAINRI